MEIEKLTDRQREFLEDYFDNILSFDMDFDGIDKDEFVKRVSGMDFDNGEPSTPGEIRVAKSLYHKGMFDDFDIHEAFFQKHIYLSFSKKGAETMYSLMTEAKLEGRLSQPKANAPTM